MDVIEHLHNSPRELLSSLVEIIKPCGYIFISVPNAVNIRKRLFVLFGKTNMPSYKLFYWSYGVWRGHVREYVKDDLIKLSEYLGVHVLELRGADHMLHKLPNFIIPFYKSITTIFPGWKDSWILTARKPKNWRPLSLDISK